LVSPEPTIDYFAGARCGVVVGDITADFGPQPPSETHVRLAELDGVPVFAERRLVSLLHESGPTLDVRRWPIGQRLTVSLDRPEKWLEFLDLPGIARRSWRRT
jgi:hypothetical protein